MTLALIIHHVGDLLICLQLLLVVIGHTAGHHYHALWIFPDCIVDGISRLLITLICYRAGINNSDIGRSSVVHYLVSSLMEAGDQCVGFILVQATTQSFK